MKEGWTYKKLGEVANVTDYVANGSFATLRENVHYLDTDGYAILVRLADYTNNFDSSRFVYIDEHAYNFLSKSKLYGGEIIMSNVGSIGKSFICPKLSKPMSLAPNSIVINTSNNRFYFYYFNSPSFQSSLKTISSKTALPKFNKTQFKGLCAPVPPIAEQERIVAELDLLSGIIEKKKEQLKTYDQLAQSIFYTMFGDPIDNPKGWQTKKLGEVCEYAKTRIPSNDISVRNYIGVENLLQNCQGKTIASKVPKDIGLTMFIEGDVLIGNIRPYLKKIWLADCQGGCNGDVLAIRRKTQFVTIVDVFYLFKCLSTDLFFEFAMQYSKGEKMPRGDKKEIMKYELLLPPLSLQQEFAEKIEAIERQKALVQQSIEETQTMFDYTMDKYFG